MKARLVNNKMTLLVKIDVCCKDMASELMRKDLKRWFTENSSTLVYNFDTNGIPLY